MSPKLFVGQAIAFGSMAAATLALAQTGPTGPGAAATGAGTSQPRRVQNDPNRRVCRTVIPTGSRMGERVCRTQAEWDQRTEHAQRTLMEEQVNHGGRDGCGPAAATQC